MRNKIQAEAVQAIKDNNYNCLIVVACRVGKTKLLIDSIRGKEDKKIAVVAPFNSILDSWRAEILKWDLGFTPTLLNIRSSEELPMDLDLLIIDECHQISDNQYKVIKSRKPKRIVGATGTLGLKNKQKIRQELGLTVKYDYSIEQAIDHNIISDYEIFIKEVTLTPEERTAYNKLTKTFEYFKMLSFSDAKYVHVKNNAALKRAQYIYRLESKLKAAQGLIKPLKRVLVFTTLTEVADKLCKHSYHSKSKEDSLELFQKKKVNKLSCIGMLSMGFTGVGLKHAVIHQIQSNEELQVQKILRTCNLEGDKKAQIYITVAKDTQDSVWCESALAQIPKHKIKWI
jgi:superfamily II DNA or RNA helicase